MVEEEGLCVRVIVQCAGGVVEGSVLGGRWCGHGEKKEMGGGKNGVGEEDEEVEEEQQKCSEEGVAKDWETFQFCSCRDQQFVG